VYPVSYATSWKKDEGDGGAGAIVLACFPCRSIKSSRWYTTIEIVSSGSDKRTEKGKKGGGLTLKTLLKPWVFRTEPTLLGILCAEEANQRYRWADDLAVEELTIAPGSTEQDQPCKRCRRLLECRIARLRLVPTIGENEKCRNTNAAFTPTRCWKSFSRITQTARSRLFVKYDNFPPPLKDFSFVNQKRLQRRRHAS
jgi:hypothetical protein